MFAFLKKLFTKPNSNVEQPQSIDFDELADTYFKAPAEEREIIRSSFGQHTFWTLLHESELCAVLAVRQQNYALVRKGLILHSIENARNDFRDNLVRFSLLYHSAKKLGQNPDILFEEIANISDTDMKALLLSFIKRTDKNKSISVMGYKEVNNPEFDYVWKG